MYVQKILSRLGINKYNREKLLQSVNKFNVSEHVVENPANHYTE